MNKIVSGLLGAMALVTAASASVAAPTLTDGAQVQAAQYVRYGHDRRAYRHYRRHGPIHRPHLLDRRDRRGFQDGYRRY